MEHKTDILNNVLAPLHAITMHGDPIFQALCDIQTEI